jgi:hypothetical protein
MSVFIFAPATVGSGLELEDGLGDLLFESGDKLLLESSDAPAAELAFPVIDENPVLAIPYYYWIPYLFFEPWPANFFEIVWTPAIGQQENHMLMPIYDERYLYGDIANMPYLSLQTFANEHFGPNADDTFAGPLSVEISEGHTDVELRTPQ